MKGRANVPEAQKTSERRISRFSRHCARIVRELRDEGELAGAARFEAIAIEIVDDMRRKGR